MNAIRILLIVLFGSLMAYTFVVIRQNGMDFMPVFFGDIARIGWPGQFNFDFTTMLTLSATWTAWRNRFSAQGLGLAVLAFLFGGGFLCLYLLILVSRHKGDAAAILLGEARAQELRK